jgi:tetratricopeptide (TPR) repeat protein
VHANRGVTLASLGRYHEALQACEDALGLDPDDSTALNNISILLSKMQRDAEAMEYLARARRLSRLKGFDWKVW